MFTPKGLSVNLRVFLIASRRASGFGWVRAVRIPRPPAFETAAASSGTPTLDEFVWNKMRWCEMNGEMVVTCEMWFVNEPTVRGK